MATPLNTIKNWFLTGLKPTQAQFWATWDSFRHKDDAIPQSDVAGLVGDLAAKAEAEQFNAHIADPDAHTELFETKADVEDISAVGFSGEYADINNKPEIASVAETYAKDVANKLVVPSGLASYQKVLTESPEQITKQWFGTKEEHDALDSLPPDVAHFVKGDLAFLGEVNEDYTTTQDADSLNTDYPDDYPTMFFVVAPFVSTGEVYIKLNSGSWMILSGTLSNPT